MLGMDLIGMLSGKFIKMSMNKKKVTIKKKKEKIKRRPKRLRGICLNWYKEKEVI